MVDLPPDIQECVVCSIIAAVKYEIPANILLAIAEKEVGKPGQWVENSNGTHDVGSMQFNTAYLKDLSRYGITADQGDIWTKVANYHSRTPKYNAKYRADMIVKAVKWADWLEERFGQE